MQTSGVVPMMQQKQRARGSRQAHASAGKSQESSTGAGRKIGHTCLDNFSLLKRVMFVQRRFRDSVTDLELVGEQEGCWTALALRRRDVFVRLQARFPRRQRRALHPSGLFRSRSNQSLKYQGSRTGFVTGDRRSDDGKKKVHHPRMWR
jgi:hypothetical protein